MNEFCSATLEAEPTEVLKYTVRPLKKDSTRLKESDRDLKNEVFSETLETEPIDAVRVTARPLDSEAGMPSEPERDLNSEECSRSPAAELIEVLKDLERHVAKLTEYQNHPSIDAARLRALMSNLIRLRADLAAAGAAWLAPLRDSEFLAAIKHRSAIPGGTCEFDLPDYYFWLSQPHAWRMATFVRWQGLLRPLCDAIAELLWLTRQNGRASEEVARGGVFNVAFDRERPYQLLRITVPAGVALYPEISGSHYRCSMRFLEWTDVDSRPRQSGADVPFTLTCCP